MSVVVYCVFDAEYGSSAYYPTLGKAREGLRDASPGSEIERLVLVDLPPRQLAARLLNHEAFVSERTVVA